MNSLVADLNYDEGAFHSWPMVPLGELGRWGSGGTPKRGTPGYYGGEIPWLKISDLTDGEVVASEERITPLALQNSSAKLLEPGALFVAMYGSIGKLGLNKIACATNQAIAFCYPNERVSLKYLFWALRALRPELISEGKGGTQQNISQGVLKNFQIPVPPRAHQDQIVEWIETALAALVEPRDRLATIPELLKKFRQSVLAAACSGQLTADWRASNTEAMTGIELAKRMTDATPSKKLRTAPVEPDLKIPETWSWSAIANIAQIRGGIQKQPHRAPKSNAYNYLRVANVMRDRLDLTELSRFELADGELETYRLQYGDLLVVEGNGSFNEIGRASIWRNEVQDCVHQNHIIRVRFNGLIPEFVNFFWNSPIGIEQVSATAVTTSGLYSLSTGKIGSLMIPVPGKSEQVEIVRRIESLFALADSIESRLAEATAQVERTTQAILAKAFRGELT